MLGASKGPLGSGSNASLARQAKYWGSRSGSATPKRSHKSASLISGERHTFVRHTSWLTPIYLERLSGHVIDGLGHLVDHDADLVLRCDERRAQHNGVT